MDQFEPQQTYIFRYHEEPKIVTFLWKHRIMTFIVAGLALMYAFFFTAPSTFPADRIVTVNRGAVLSEIAIELKEAGVIKSSVLFQTSAILLGGEGNIVAGDYYFPANRNVISLARRMSVGDFQNAPLALIVPEGYTVEQIGELFDEYLPRFDKQKFLFLARGKEGYLFPDTYFFFRSAREEEVFNSLTSNFDEQIASIQERIDESGYTLEELIIFASLVEKEANNTRDDKRIIAGIIENRLEKDMLLQIDATLWYTLGKASAQLSRADLNDDKNPYNTYVFKGLPPGPIGNPGMEAIEAVLNPQETSYIFYLHAPDGTPYYSVTHDGHVRNKQLYLR